MVPGEAAGSNAVMSPVVDTPSVENSEVPKVELEVSPVSTSTEFHEQAPGPDDPEIRRQAEAIIASLAVQGANEKEPSVSHETIATEPSIEEETNAIESTIQRSIAASLSAQESEETEAVSTPPVVMPDVFTIQQSLREAQERQGYSQIPPTQPLADSIVDSPGGSIPVQIAEEDPVKPEKQILNQVREQVSMLGEVNTLPTAEATRDDQDILETGHQAPDVTSFAPPATEEAMPAWAQREPSQGEAARVDYQKLFDQLRNVQGTQE